MSNYGNAMDAAFDNACALGRARCGYALKYGECEADKAGKCREVAPNLRAAKARALRTPREDTCLTP